MSKHDDVIKYIYGLEVGARISVRSVANDLGISEGTAYRAIKGAEVEGIVNTIPRIGTVRIEKVEKKSIENLTFADVVNIVEGSILGGKEGLYKTLNKFLIGAMTIDVMKKYIVPGNILIVGNREEAQKLALESQCAVLITGGFDCSDEIKNLANEKKLPIISCAFDTFTTATMINKAISESLIKKDIILVEDIMEVNAHYVRINNTVAEVKELMRKTGHSKFPILDEKEELVGIVTAKDLAVNISENEMITRIMTRDPIVVTPKTSAAYIAHVMTWEEIKLIPVVENKKLVGIVSRHDVMKALQYISRQPQVGETIDDMIMSNFTYSNIDRGVRFEGKIIPQMLNTIGTASWNVLTFMMSTAGTFALRQKNHLNAAVDAITIFYIKPIQMDSTLIINAKIIDISRNFAKIEVEMAADNEKNLIGKALLSTRLLRR